MQATFDFLAADSVPNRSLESIRPEICAAIRLKPADGDYKFARRSKYSNVGEDVQASARHRANEWRGLDAAELDGSAARVINREKLMKLEPIRLDFDDESTSRALCAYLCLRAFPAAPGKADDLERHARRGGMSAAEIRRRYFNEYIIYRDFLAQGFSAGEDALTMRRAASRELGRLSRISADVLFNYRRSSLMVGRVTADSTVYQQLERAEHFSAADVRTLIESGDGVPTGRTVKRKANFDEKTAYSGAVVRRGGKEIVSPVHFLTDSVKIRAIQWGNYVPDRERPEHARLLAEAFSDLAEALGVSSDRIGQESLAIAIGARGHGAGVLAHYESSEKVINLTRKSGAGALAHEYGHFLDYTAGNGRVATENACEGEWAVLRAVLGQSSYFKRLRSIIREYVSSYKKIAYWLSTREVFARFFEVYVGVRLHEMGRENGYLSGVNGHILWPTTKEVEEVRGVMEAAITAVL